MLPQKVLHLHLEESKKNPKINHSYMVSEKLDGIYTYADYITGVGWSPIKSRVARTIPSMDYALNLLYKLPTPKVDCRLIMEATIPGLDFHTANGIFNRSVGECQAVDTVFKLHDYVPLNTYFKNLPENKAIGRWNILKQLDLSSSKGKLEHIPLLAVSNSKAIWMHYAEQVWDNGGEGVVLKQEDALYQPDKRNSSLMKIKLECAVDLECIALYYTIGEKGNRNLNLRLRRRNGIIVPVRVPKHEDIALFEADSSQVLGQVVEVKAMKELKDGALREPRFFRVRYDKELRDID